LRKGSIEANNGDTLGQLAAAGVGITRVGAFSVAADIAAGRLVPVLEEFNTGDEEVIHALFAGRANVPARLRAFVEDGGRPAFSARAQRDAIPGRKTIPCRDLE
jgi:DNA-binding transcriptional LysR family regulator